MRMKANIVYLFLMLLAPLSVFSQTAQINNPASPTVPFNSNSSYSYGIMPSNLPVAGTYTQSQDAANAYTTWVSNYVVSCGGVPVQYRVLWDDGTSTVSEGIGYGMLLAAYAGDKTMFDGLWAYYRASRNGNGLMNWKMSNCSTIAGGGTNGASDADEDAAMALIVAACQWPTATSPYTYSTEATNLITAIKNCEIDTKSPIINQMSNGDGWIGCNAWSNTCRNPSYMAPAYYKQFAAYVPAQAATWNAVTTTSYTLLNANRNATTGLVSNWCDQSGTANGCNGTNEYGYDACRNPWRMAADMIWYNDANASAICNKLATYVTGRTAASVGGAIPQTGGAGTHNATFVSTFAAGIVGATPAGTYQTIMDQMYTQTLATTDALPKYFGNTLRVISLFMMSGNFWKPCPAPMPIQNFMFEGIMEEESVRLLWSTDIEKDLDRFEVQKSFDGITFFNIANVKSNNNSASNNYYFLDSELPAPISYYRIAQYKLNGVSDFSETICKQKSISKITVSPNPFESELRISISPVPIGKVFIRIADISGKSLYETEEEDKREIIINKDFKEGLYFIYVTTADKAYVEKIVHK